MPEAVVLQHLAFEDLGTIADVLATRAITARIAEVGMGFDAERAADGDLLIVLGGPIGVGDGDRYPVLAAERQVIGERLAARRPVLGICLGAQLLADAGGGAVTAGAVDEIGWAPVELTAAGSASPLAPLRGHPVLHWHQDAITRLPTGASHLASTATTTHQAFAHAASLGLQFHLEIRPEEMERWLIGHAGGLAGRELAWFAEQRRIAHTAAAELPAVARQILHAWLDEVDVGRA